MFKQIKNTLNMDPAIAMLLSCWAAWFVNFIARMSIPVMLPSIRNEFGVSHTEVGLVMTVITLAYALTQVPSGFAADRIKSKYVIVPGMTVFSVAAIMASKAGNFWSLLLTASLIGLGLGTYYTPSFSLISGWFERSERGKAIGFHETASSLGSVVGPVAGGALVGFLGWRYGMGILAIPGLLVIPLIWYFGKEPKKASKLGKMQIKAVAPLLIIFCLVATAWMGVITFVPSYLDSIGFSESVAGILFAIMPLSSVFFMPIAGHISDKIGRMRVIAILLLVASPLIVLLTFIEGIILIILINIMMGATMFASYPVLIALIADNIPHDAKGITFGAVNAISMGFASGAPILVGFIIDGINFQAGFLSLSLMVILAFLIAQKIRQISEILNLNV